MNARELLKQIQYAQAYGMKINFNTATNEVTGPTPIETTCKVLSVAYDDQPYEKPRAKLPPPPVR